MNSALHDLSADEFWLVRLFRCLSEEEQHDTLVALAEEVLLARLANVKLLPDPFRQHHGLDAVLN